MTGIVSDQYRDILLAGPRRCGKSTVLDLIEERLDGECERATPQWLPHLRRRTWILVDDLLEHDQNIFQLWMEKAKSQGSRTIAAVQDPTSLPPETLRLFHTIAYVRILREEDCVIMFETYRINGDGTTGEKDNLMPAIRLDPPDDRVPPMIGESH